MPMMKHCVYVSQPLSGGAFLWVKKARSEWRAGRMNIYQVFLLSCCVFTICDKAAQLRGLFRFAGCGSPLLILRVAGLWTATVEENPGKGRNNGV